MLFLTHDSLKKATKIAEKVQYYMTMSIIIHVKMDKEAKPFTNS